MSHPCSHKVWWWRPTLGGQRTTRLWCLQSSRWREVHPHQRRQSPLSVGRPLLPYHLAERSWRRPVLVTKWLGSQGHRAVPASSWRTHRTRGLHCSSSTTLWRKWIGTTFRPPSGCRERLGHVTVPVEHHGPRLRGTAGLLSRFSCTAALMSLTWVLLIGPLRQETEEIPVHLLAEGSLGSSGRGASHSSDS